MRRFHCILYVHVHVHGVCTYIQWNLRIKDTIQSTKKSLSYSASTFLTSE